MTEAQCDCEWRCSQNDEGPKRQGGMRADEETRASANDGGPADNFHCAAEAAGALEVDPQDVFDYQE